MSDSQEEQGATDPTTVQSLEKTIELPELLGLVDFQCSNFVRLASNSADVRIAFGDLGPTGKMTPRTGFALSHAVAKSLQKALSRQIETLEEKYGPITDSPVEIGIVAPKVESEADEADSL